MSYRNLTCKNCGWVHFAVSRAYAIDQTSKFATYFNSLTKQKQLENYSGRQISLLREYGSCKGCGAPNSQARDSFPHEIQRIIGCTVSGWIVPEENVI